MKYLIAATISLFFSVSALTQSFTLNIGTGLMNYGGDLQSSRFTFNQSHPCITAGIGIKIRDHLTTNFSVTAGKISASDAKGKARYRGRNLSFGSSIGEASLTLQYDLFDLTAAKSLTPYGFIGIGGFGFKPYAYDTAGNKIYLRPLGTEGQEIPEYSNKKLYGLTQFEIPMGIGAKYAINDHMFLGAEFGFRKLFTDYLDDVSGYNYADTAVLRSARGPQAAEMAFRAGEIAGSKYPISGQRGNPKVKDNFYTVVIKLTVSFDKSYFLF
jgi:hypothetical protein